MRPQEGRVWRKSGRGQRAAGLQVKAQRRVAERVQGRRRAAERNGQR